MIEARNDIRTNQLDKIGPEMLTAYGDILSKVVDRQNMLGSQMSATAEQKLILTSIFSGVALLLGIVAAGAIARWISRSVREATDSMTKLAKGDLDITIKGTGLNHEFGFMAKALLAFNDNAETTRKLQEEKKVNAKAMVEADANQLASSANDAASKDGEVVGRAVKAMGDIEGSAQKIVDIIGVIDEITFRTNLLALNDSVEAARAGEAGKLTEMMAFFKVEEGRDIAISRKARPAPVKSATS